MMAKELLFIVLLGVKTAFVEAWLAYRGAGMTVNVHASFIHLRQRNKWRTSVCRDLGKWRRVSLEKK